MRRRKFLLPGYIIAGLLLCISGFAQTETFSDSNLEYTFELPEPAWKMIEKPSAANPNVEYVHNDRMEGYFEIRKLTVQSDELISDVIAREQEQRLQFKPGFVAGKEENFQGLLKGKVYNWEYVQAGRNMSGRYYFLRFGDTTVYVLRFTGLRDKLRSIRNQTDSIARTFRIKAAAEKSDR
jgi:hypothetical protein